MRWRGARVWKVLVPVKPFTWCAQKERKVFSLTGVTNWKAHWVETLKSCLASFCIRILSSDALDCWMFDGILSLQQEPIWELYEKLWIYDWNRLSALCRHSINAYRKYRLPACVITLRSFYAVATVQPKSLIIILFIAHIIDTLTGWGVES